MSAIRSLAARVQKLEQARRAPRSPFEVMYGSLDAFEVEVRADVAAGKLDAREMVGADGNGGVLRAVRAWHESGVFGMWVRNGVWEIGGR